MTVGTASYSNQVRISGLLLLLLSGAFQPGCIQPSGDGSAGGELDAGDTDAETSTRDSLSRDLEDARDAVEATDARPPDLMVSNLRLELVPPREVGEFHNEIMADVSNTGATAAEGLNCRYRVVPLDTDANYETIEEEIAIAEPSLEPGEQRVVSGEILIRAKEDSEDENYDARFEVSCSASNEPAEFEDDNQTTLETDVIFF